MIPPNNFWWLSRSPPPPHVFIFQANLSGPPFESFQSFQRSPLRTDPPFCSPKNEVISPNFLPPPPQAVNNDRSLKALAEGLPRNIRIAFMSISLFMIDLAQDFTCRLANLICRSHACGYFLPHRAWLNYGSNPHPQYVTKFKLFSAQYCQSNVTNFVTSRAI